jgi:tetratricopeptide (TPR) repeat protein
MPVPGISSTGTPRPSTAAQDPRSAALDLLTAGIAAESSGKRKDAIALYRQSISVSPSPAAWYHLGRALAADGRKNEAVAAFDTALSLSPSYETARVARDRLLKRQVQGQVDLVSLDREAETAHSLAETAQIMEERGTGLLAQARTPAPRARTGVGIPQPPAIPVSTPGVQSPRSSPDSSSPAARESDDEARSKIVENTSKPIIYELNARPSVGERIRNALRPNRGKTPSAAGETGPGEVITRQRPESPDPGMKPDSSPGRDHEGGAATTENAGGGRGASLLPRLGIFRQLPPPVPLPSSRVVDGKDATAINEAAFSSEAARRPSSTGYGQATGTAALGTFAFHRDRGDQLRMAERWADALTEYEYALRLAPGDAETRALLGEMQARVGDSRRALRNLDQAARDNPSLAAVPYRRGNALRALKRYDEAIGAYLDALRLDGRHADSLNNLGVTYMETNRPDRAAATFERLLQIHPNHPNALLNLGILYEDSLNNPKAAEAYYERYLALGDVPRKTEVRRWLTLLRRRN